MITLNGRIFVPLGYSGPPEATGAYDVYRQQCLRLYDRDGRRIGIISNMALGTAAPVGGDRFVYDFRATPAVLGDYPPRRKEHELTMVSLRFNLRKGGDTAWV